MTTQREYTPPPLPKSAPIQSQLTNSTKQKRIPPLYQVHSRDSSVNQKHKNLPELQTSIPNTPTRHPNTAIGALPGFKVTPVSDSYRHVKSASSVDNDGGGNNSGGKGNDKKRLVDQFYDQLGTPPSSSNGTRVTTPVITRNNTATSLVNESRTNLVLNKFEVEKKQEDRIGKKTSKIGEEIERLEILIVRRIKEQVEVNEDEFMEKVYDFQSVEEEIKNIKLKVKGIIDMIEMENYKNFEEDYDNFEVEIKMFLQFLKILEEYELKLNNSRDKMNQYKRQLYDIRKTIELGEMMKVAEHRKLQNRNRWMSIILMFSFVAFVFYKLL